MLDHHERLDGGGYPRGLRAEQIGIATRVLTVCDVFDALVSDRVYRPAWSRERALGLLQAESGEAFDARCVAALVRSLERYAGSPSSPEHPLCPPVPLLAWTYIPPFALKESVPEPSTRLCHPRQQPLFCILR